MRFDAETYMKLRHLICHELGSDNCVACPFEAHECMIQSDDTENVIMQVLGKHQNHSSRFSRSKSSLTHVMDVTHISYSKSVEKAVRSDSSANQHIWG